MPIKSIWHNISYDTFKNIYLNKKHDTNNVNQTTFTLLMALNIAFQETISQLKTHRV